MSSFLRYYFRALSQAPSTGAFSWAAVLGNAVAAGLLHHFGLFPNKDPSDVDSIKFAFYGAAAVFFISFFIFAFLVAPLRAWQMLQPIKLSVSNTAADPEIKTEYSIRGKTISIIVENRSSEHLLDCCVRINSIKDVPLGETEQQMVPRFVEKFDMPPNTTKRVTIAYWFQRDQPNKDDPSIGICGPISAGFGGNVLRIPLAKSKIDVVVASTEGRSKSIEFFIWVETQSRDLKSRLCTPPSFN